LFYFKLKKKTEEKQQQEKSIAKEVLKKSK